MASFQAHPKAFLAQKRNVRAGLTARSKILNVIERREATISEISKLTDLSYGDVNYHLRLLLKENIVKIKTPRKPYIWLPSPYGQQKLPLPTSK